MEYKSSETVTGADKPNAEESNFTIAQRVKSQAEKAKKEIDLYTKFAMQGVFAFEEKEREYKKLLIRVGEKRAQLTALEVNLREANRDIFDKIKIDAENNAKTAGELTALQQKLEMERKAIEEEKRKLKLIKEEKGK